MKQQQFLRWCLYATPVAAIAIVLARMKWPDLKFDDTSLWLFGIAAGVVVLLTLPVTRFKYGDIEIILQRDLDGLESRLAASARSESKRDSGRRQPTAESGLLDQTWQQYFSEYRRIVGSATSNIEKIVSVAILIEQMIESAGVAYDVPKDVMRKGARKIVSELSREDLITEDEKAAFYQFWNIRNRAIHGEYGEPTDAQAARILDLGWRLVKMLA